MPQAPPVNIPPADQPEAVSKTSLNNPAGDRSPSPTGLGLRAALANETSSSQPAPATPGIVVVDRAAAQSLGELQIGDRVHAQVARDPQSGEPGFVINGKFVKASVPTELKEGQQVTLEVLSTSGKLTLRVITGPSAENSELPEAIIKALSTLKLSENSIKNLRSALVNLPPKDATEILFLDDSDLAHPIQIKQRLIAALNPERLKALPAVRENPKLLDALQLLREALVSALKSDSAPSSPGLTKLAEIFLNFARTLGCKCTSEATLQADLKTLIGTQTEYLKKVEDRIRQFLSLPDAPSSFEEMRRTLENIRLPESAEENPLVNDVINFVRELKATFSGLTEGSPELPKVIQAALDTIGLKLLRNHQSIIPDSEVRNLEPQLLPPQVTESLKILSNALNNALAATPRGAESDWLRLLPPGFDPLESPELLGARGSATIGKLSGLQIRALRGLLAALENFSKLKAQGAERPPELDSLISELRQAVDHSVKHQEPLKKELLQKALQQVSETEQSLKHLSQQKALVATRVEQFVQGQETLRTLNQAMKILGEPSFVFLPLLVHGFLSQLELSVPNAPSLTSAEDENSGKRKNPKKSEEILFSLSLPSLGNVAVAISHQQQSARVAITFEDETIAEFMRMLLPQLESRLRSVGFEPSLTAKANAHRQSIKPDWLQQLTNPSRVIA